MRDVLSEETIPAGPWARLVVSRPLSRRERRRLEKAAALGESLLDEEE